MAKRNRNKPNREERRLAMGRGDGEGHEYQPWLRVQDVASDGNATRLKGLTTGREHHLLSTLERYYFYLAEWDRTVVDIREQFPLKPLERTAAIADRLGLTHPRDRLTNELTMMTTDFLLTVSEQGGRQLKARTIKPVGKLTRRALEKFRIEHAYFADQGIDWGFVTDQELPHPFVDNLDILWEAVDTTAIHLDAATWEHMKSRLWELLSHPGRSVAESARLCDVEYNLQLGTGLWAVKHMLATQQWTTDLTSRPLQLTDALTLTMGSGLQPDAERQAQ